MSLYIAPVTFSTKQFAVKQQKPVNVEKSEMQQVETDYLRTNSVNVPVNFGAIKELVKPVIKWEGVDKKLFDKFVRFYTELIPANSVTTKPILVKDGESFIGFTIDKTRRGITRVVMKDALKSADDWASTGKTQTILEAQFDNKSGLMKEAQYVYSKYVRGNEGEMTTIGEHYAFERFGKNKRRIFSSNIEFSPSAEFGDFWKSVTETFTKKIDLQDVELMESHAIKTIFREFVQPHASILGK